MGPVALSSLRRPVQRVGFSVLAAAAAATSLLLPIDAARAGCNIIPAAVKPLRSTNGLVDRPVASPGDTVTLQTDLACRPSTAGFAKTPSANSVVLTFLSPAPAGPTTVVPVGPASVRVRDCGDTRCRTLQFEMPSTSSEASLPSGHGLTGPARISVTRSGIVEPVVVIDDLFQPSLACEGTQITGEFAQDDVFRKFTVLPPPNRLPLGTSPGATILAAVDGSGSLVVPIDFRDVLQAPAGSLFATLFKIALSPEAAVALPAEEFDQPPPMPSVLRSFNSFGRPIPPLLRAAESGGQKVLLGSTDVLASLMRVSRTTPDPPLVAFEELMEAGKGPVVLPSGEVTVLTAAPLEALRIGSGAVAAAADEGRLGTDLNDDEDLGDLVVGITDLATGTQTNTGRVIAEVSASPPRPAIVTDGDLVAFLESEARSGTAGVDYTFDGDEVDSVLRVYTADGIGRSSGGLSVDPNLLVDGRTMAISRAPSGAPFVFFRTAEADEVDRLTDLVTENGYPEFSSFESASSDPAISSDGFAVAFATNATDVPVFPAKTSSTYSDVFVTGSGFCECSFEFVSTSGGGSPGNGDSMRPSLSRDGRFVAFDSTAPGLAEDAFGSGSFVRQVYVKNRFTDDVTEISALGGGSLVGISAEPGGGPAADDSFAASISDSGRFVAFTSSSSSLVDSPPLNGNAQVFLRDRDSDGNGIFDEVETSETVLVSRAQAGGAAASGAGSPSISADGRFVAFDSSSSDLVPSDTNGAGDVFVFDRIGSTVERVSVADGGIQVGGVELDSYGGTLDADGRFVAFTSDATNLVPDDTNGVRDVFVFDRIRRTVERVSVDAHGVEANGGSTAAGLSADGRFVAFVSTATNLVPGAPGTQQVYVHDRRTRSVELASVSSSGGVANGSSGEAAIAGDGRDVAFSSVATNLASDSFSDSNEARDVFRSGTRRFDEGSLNGDFDLRDTVLRAFDVTTESVLSNAEVAADEVATAAARALVLVPEADQDDTNLNGAAQTKLQSPASNDLDTRDVVVELFDAPSNERINLGVAVTRAAISDQVVCLAVSEAAQGNTDLNGDEDANDDVLVVGKVAELLAGGLLTNTERAVGAVGAVGPACVAIDRTGVLVLYTAGAATPAFFETGRRATDFIVSPTSPLVAFRTSEGPTEEDFNEDGDLDDEVMQVLDLELAGILGTSPAPDLPDGALTNTQREAILCALPGCEAFRFYSVRADRTVSFLGTEPGQAVGPGCLATSPPGECDLDGDGLGTGTVVHVVKVQDGVVRASQVVPVSQLGTPGVDPFADPTGMVMLTAELTECEAARKVCPETRTRSLLAPMLTVETACEAAFDVGQDGQLDCVNRSPFIAGDHDGDGVLDVSTNGLGDNCVETPNPTQLDADLDLLGDVFGTAQGCDPNPTTVLPGDRSCDMNDDGRIDRDDVDLVFRDAGTPADASDRRDRDRDGVVTVLDSRICAAQCTYANCAPAPLMCGLLGPEVLLPLVALRARRWWRRRAAPTV